MVLYSRAIQSKAVLLNNYFLNIFLRMLCRFTFSQKKISKQFQLNKLNFLYLFKNNKTKNFKSIK